MQVRLAKVLEGRAYDAAVHAEAHAAEALDALRAGDYLALSLIHRFAILNLLLSIALSTELLRCALAALMPPWRSPVWPCVLGRAAKHAASMRPPAWLLTAPCRAVGRPAAYGV